MDSHRLQRSLRIPIIALFLVATASGQDRRTTGDTNDSSDSIKKKVDGIVEEVMSSIRNEWKMTFGPSAPRKPHKPAMSDSERTNVTDENFTIDGSDSTITYTGDTVVGVNDTLRGSVVVYSGSITVNGYIDGDVTVNRGNIIVNYGGRITGNATAYRGTIERNDGGSIGGVMYESSEDSRSYSHRHKDYDHGPSFGWDNEFHQQQKHGYPNFNLNLLTNSATNYEPFLFRYNRVDGLFFGLGREERRPWETSHTYSFHGSMGYGFGIHRWQYNIGLNLFPRLNDAAEMGIEYHSSTDTRDAWLINRNENTAASFLIHEDFYDYYFRKGLDIHAAIYPARDFRARVDYLADEYESLARETDWALFGGDKHFRPNPPINDGLMRSVVASLDYSTIEPSWWMREGWDAHASAEFAGTGLGGDFSFDRYLLDLRRYQPLGDFTKLSARIRLGSSHGSVPYQKAFEFGGIGTVNAFPYKYFAGNRMALANVEYMLHGGALEDADFWPVQILSPFSFMLFLDAGWSNVASADDSFNEGFENLSLKTLKSDWGAGIGTRDGTVRVGWAWRTDHRSSPVFFFRMSRPF